MAQKVRSITSEDKLLLAIVLLNAGIKARLRVIRNGIRLVAIGSFDREHLASVLNVEGFRAAGGAFFGHHDFQDGQLFLRGVAA